jgi:hypothetical protein
MLTHVVMFKLIDRTVENARQLHDRLLTLPNQIPQIKHMEVGVNILPSDRAYDVVLFQRFDSLADMQAYQAHPAHVEVLAYIKSVIAGSVAVDYAS